MNYLYQASRLIALKNKAIASYYGSTMIGCAKKAVLRVEPRIKRTTCKYCQTPLIPGETATVRLTSKPVKAVKWRCLACTNVRRYPTKGGYDLWTDQPDSIVQTFRYAPLSRKGKQAAEEGAESLCNRANPKEIRPRDGVDRTS